MKTSIKVMLILSGIIAILSTILGFSYILTGNTIELEGTTYFVGHLKNLIKNPDSPSEIMAIIAFLVIIVAWILFSIGAIVATKGIPREEKKMWGKKQVYMQIALCIQLISSFILMLMVPKDDMLVKPKIIYFYLILLLMFAAGIFALIGIVFTLKQQNSLINNEDAKIKDEF